MILQKDPRFRAEIQRWACYVMSLLWFAVKFLRYPLSVDSIRDLIRSFIDAGWLGEDMYVKNPDRILGFFGLQVTVRKESPHYFCSSDEFEILVFQVETKEGKVWKHFVAGDGSGHVTYDPYGLSRAVRKGTLISKRVFRRV